MKKYRLPFLSAAIGLALVVILMFVALGSRSTSAQGKPALQKWEYCEVGTGDIVYHLVDVPRQERITNRSGTIAKLGVDGWELVCSGTRYYTNYSETLLVFKRPK
jgi:hypothetical protein